MKYIVVFSFWGASPTDSLTRGSAAGPRWGHSPQTPIIGSRYRARHSPPNAKTKLRLCFYCLQHWMVNLSLLQCCSIINRHFSHIGKKNIFLRCFCSLAEKPPKIYCKPAIILNKIQTGLDQQIIDLNSTAERVNINYCVRGGHKPARWPWPTSTLTEMEK